MRRVSFEISGNTAWYGFYTGFGLFVSGYLLFTVLLTWRLSEARSAEAGLARSLAWILFGLQLANIALCIHYFGPVQVIFATVCAVTVGAALQTQPARE